MVDPYMNRKAYLAALNALHAAQWEEEVGCECRWSYDSVEKAEAALASLAYVEARDDYVDAFQAVYDVEPWHPWPLSLEAVDAAMDALASP